MAQHSGFTMTAYGRLLDALTEARYACRSFVEDDGSDGVVLLRHDVDKSVERALTMAEFEHARGVRSSYFFLTRGALYNLLEPETRLAVQRIATLGHDVGLHCDESRVPGALDTLDQAVLDEIDVLEHLLGQPVSKAVTFHNPSKAVIMRSPSADYVSGYDPRFMLPATKYISESNAHWREGDPVDMIRSREYARLQILVHPLWWTWEAPLPVLDVLNRVLDERHAAMDRYLSNSNHLWKEARGQGA